MGGGQRGNYKRGVQRGSFGKGARGFYTRGRGQKHSVNAKRNEENISQPKTQAPAGSTDYEMGPAVPQPVPQQNQQGINNTTKGVGVTQLAGINQLGQHQRPQITFDEVTYRKWQEYEEFKKF